MANLRFDNLVVVITGAGGGLGKCYALEYGRRGAKVVVNDLGSSTLGEGKSSKAADQVVEEIKSLGGEAVANYDSVENGDKIIKTAIDAFGKIDILINNAGILRDKSMLKMEENDWDIIMNVHLKGAFMTTKAAWPYMRRNGFGRIINTSSGSGLYGNFGQSNYGAAKLGLVGMTRALAREGQSVNVLANAIAPTSISRMTEDILPQDLHNIMTPERIAPLVVYLTHPSCDINGKTFEVGGGWITEVRSERAVGAIFSGEMTAEQLATRFSEVEDFSSPSHPENVQDVIQRLVNLHQLGPNSTNGENIDSKTVMGLIKTYFDSGAELPLKEKLTFYFEIKSGSNIDTYTIALEDGKGQLTTDKPEKPDATFKVADADFVLICKGELNPQMAFMQGKMKITGSIAKATKFTPALFPAPTPETLAKYPPAKL